MKKVIFRGSGVAIITPMDELGKVNYDVLGEIIDEARKMGYEFQSLDQFEK